MLFMNEENILDAIIEKEKSKNINSIIRELKPKHVLIILLRYWLDMPCNKIAAILKTSPNSVRVTLTYIRKKLKAKIRKSDYFPTSKKQKP